MVSSETDPTLILGTIANTSRKGKLRFVWAALILIAISAFLSGLVLVKSDLFGSGSETGNKALGWIGVFLPLLAVLGSFFINRLITDDGDCTEKENIRRLDTKAKNLAAYTSRAMEKTMEKQKKLDILQKAASGAAINSTSPKQTNDSDKND